MRQHSHHRPAEGFVGSALARPATVARTQTAGPFGGPPDPGNIRVSQVLLVVTVVMAVLAGANTIFTTWATITDTRRFSAVVRALSATPE